MDFYAIKTYPANTNEEELLFVMRYDALHSIAHIHTAKKDVSKPTNTRREYIYKKKSCKNVIIKMCTEKRIHTCLP